MADQNHALYPGQEARQRFGRTLKLWRIRAGWRQDTLSKWAKVAGFPGMTDAVFNGLERGMVEQPKPLSFIQLGMANERLARQDYGRLTDRKLKDLVEAQEAITNEDGTPWTAVDFFAHFCGDKPPPPWALQAAILVMTPEEAEKLSWQQREMFLKNAQERMLDRIEAWNQLEQYCAAMTREQVKAFKLVLAGHKAWTPEELAGMTAADGSNLAVNALQSWCDAENLCEQFRSMVPD